MANEKTLEILKEMKADPKAKELFEEIGRNYASENMVSTLSAIAEKLGYNITAQDIKEAIEQEETRRKAKTDKVVSDMEALEDDDLEGVAGGADVGKQEGIYYYRCMGGLGSGRIYRCAWNFTDDDCLDEDACAWLVQNYYNCPTSYHTLDPWDW